MFASVILSPELGNSLIVVQKWFWIMANEVDRLRGGETAAKVKTSKTHTHTHTHTSWLRFNQPKVNCLNKELVTKYPGKKPSYHISIQLYTSRNAYTPNTDSSAKAVIFKLWVAIPTVVGKNI